MSSPKIQELIAKARELAVDGDYSSSLVYYEECKIQFEKYYGINLLPSQKRVCFFYWTSIIVLWCPFIWNTGIKRTDERD